MSVTIKPTRYNVCGLAEDDVDSLVWSLNIEWRGPGDCWAVMRHAYCLSVSGKWDMEPQPSSRTDYFKRRHRFTLEEATKRALEAYPKVVINGLRVEEGKLVPA